MAKRRVPLKKKPQQTNSLSWQLIVPLVCIVALAGLAVYLLIGPGTNEESADESAVLVPAPVTFDPVSIDFGSMPVNSIDTRNVRVTNAGSGPLRILGARSSCACLSVDIAPVTVQPGMSVPMTLTIDALSTLGQRQFTASVLVAGHDHAVLNVQRTTVMQ